MYPFTGTDMLNEFVGIFGEENVRLISEEEFQRHALRMQQDRELQECEGADDQQAKQIEDQHLCPQASSEPTTPPPELVRRTAEAAAPMTLEQLRKKRLAYFEGKKNQEQWRQRLRPRTK